TPVGRDVALPIATNFTPEVLRHASGYPKDEGKSGLTTTNRLVATDYPAAQARRRSSRRSVPPNHCGPQAAPPLCYDRVAATPVTAATRAPHKCPAGARPAGRIVSDGAGRANGRIPPTHRGSPVPRKRPAPRSFVLPLLPRRRGVLFPSA